MNEQSRESKHAFLSATVSACGEYDGEPIQHVDLSNGTVRVELINLGCAITALYTPGGDGQVRNIVAGFSDIEEYKNNMHYFGCVVGRYANRIAKGRFTIGGKEYQLELNDGVNHLHGGWHGFHKKLWTIIAIIQDEEESGVVFEYISKDGEEGYPGNLRVTVTCILTLDNKLSVQYKAVTDKATPVSLTNHSYFNLSGFEVPHILDHWLRINAATYTPKNEYNTPTGAIEPVKGTALDFIHSKTIGRDIDQLAIDKGFDHNFVLDKTDPEEMVLAAELTDVYSGRWLKVYTDTPAVQLYTGNIWNGEITGPQGVAYNMHGALALETQFFPDSPNQPGFPNTILKPGALYLSNTIYEFGVK